MDSWAELGFCSPHSTCADRGDFKKAGKQVADCQRAAAELSPIIEAKPQLRQGSFSGAMEVSTGPVLRENQVTIAEASQRCNSIDVFNGRVGNTELGILEMD